MKSVGLASSRENEMSSLCIWNINLEIGYKKSPFSNNTNFLFCFIRLQSSLIKQTFGWTQTLIYLSNEYNCFAFFGQ